MLRHGRVVAADGEGVAGALVWIERSAWPAPEIAVRTDASGGFAVVLGDGPATLAARASDGRTGSLSIDGPVSPLVIVLTTR